MSVKGALRLSDTNLTELLQHLNVLPNREYKQAGIDFLPGHVILKEKWCREADIVGEKRLWKLDQGLCVLLMLLIPLQLCLSIANLFYGIDKGDGHSFPLWSYVLSAAYLCVVLSADGFMICVGRLELSKFVGRYWLSACGALAVAALLRLVPEGGMIALLLLAYTPVLVLVPLLETLGIGEISPMMAAVGMFCLCNWLICRCFVRKK